MIDKKNAHGIPLNEIADHIAKQVGLDEQEAQLGRISPENLSRRISKPTSSEVCLFHHSSKYMNQLGNISTIPITSSWANNKNDDVNQPFLLQTINHFCNFTLVPPH